MLRLCRFLLITVVVWPTLSYADEIRLNNGDRLTGTVVRMSDNSLVFKTSYAGELSIKWKDVVSIVTEKNVDVVLSDETRLKGATKEAEEGKMKVKMGTVAETVAFDLSDVTSINPKEVPSVRFRTRVNAGLDVEQGNTDKKTYHIDGELIARTDRSRYTVRAEYNREEDDGKRSSDDQMGSIKYDFFLTNKWYLFNTAFFEKDKFKDIQLRTAFGAGLGHQFFDTDLTSLGVELGFSYVNENFDNQPDNDFFATNWAVDFEKALFEKKLILFHRHIGYLSVEDTSDIFVRSRTGFRLPIQKHFNLTAQYNWDWDNAPAPGDDSVDQQYIVTFGYQFGNF